MSSFHTRPPKDTFPLTLAHAFPSTAQETNGFGDPRELLKEEQKTEPTIKREDFVLQRSVFTVRMKILIHMKCFLRKF